MPRHNDYREHDDAGAIDGDAGFIGMDSRTNPASLQAGVVSFSKNMRLDRATARPRKGVVAQNLGIELEFPPVILPFVLPVEGVVLRNDYDSGARCAGVYKGKAFLKEPITFTKNGKNYDWTAQHRGREYIMRSHKLQTELTEKEFIILVFASDIYLFDAEEGEVIREFNIPATDYIPDTDQIHVIQAYDHVIVFRGRDEDGKFLTPLVWNGDPDTEFELAPEALAYYSIPKSSWATYCSSRLIVPLEYIRINIDKIKVTEDGKIATVETPLDHGLKVGLKVHIFDAETALLNGEKIIKSITEAEYDNESKELTKPATFTYDAGLDTDLVDGGKPYAGYTTRDEYVMSGLLEPFEYDLIKAHFRINKGSADFLVGIVPYQEDSVIVFMRKSVYLHNKLFDLENSGPVIVTDQIGCLSRKTIATIGKNIFFLSDEGVYSLEIAAQLDLTGAGEPLSKDIDDQIRRINVTFAHRACACFCENRYYLAAPVDGSERNNAIFIYNTINRKWESIDEYPEALYFDTLVCATVKGRKRVLGVSRGGGISLLEEREDGDEVGTIGQSAYSIVPVNAEIRSRNYSFNTPESKRFNRIQTEVGYDAGDEWSVNVKVENPDYETPEKTLTHDSKGEITTRHAVRKTAHRLMAIYKTNKGRPELRQFAIEGNVKTSDNKKK